VLPVDTPRFSDPFFSTFLAGVGDEASRQRYDLLVSVASPGSQEENTYHRLVRSRRVDGFLLIRTRISDWRVEYLLEQQVPFVAFGRSQTGADSPYIGVDGQAGMQTLVEHLVSLGHKHIAFISAPPELTLAQDRLSGFHQGLRAAGLTARPEWVVGETLRREGGYQAAKRILSNTPRPTALIGANDRSALGALRAGQELNLRVGHDLAIAGFDGTEASAHSHPPLTTIRQPVYDIGRQVTKMLLSIIEDRPSANYQLLLEPNLIIRPSTDPSASTNTNPEGDR
jgi:LacI family transcriptional regulator